MICKKCGKEVNDESTFCAHCGCDLRETTSSNDNHTTEDQVPLVLLINQIVKHKIIAIISVLVVASAICGYFVFKNHQEKKQAEEAFLKELDHIMDVIGTYKNEKITLVLSADNTAKITYKGGYSYSDRSGRGYWREKYDGLIEIEFSQSLEDIYIGHEKHYYCRTLYLVGNTLWESMSAIKSQDYSSCERLSKE